MKLLKYYYDLNVYNFIFTTLTIEDRNLLIQSIYYINPFIYSNRIKIKQYGKYSNNG